MKRISFISALALVFLTFSAIFADEVHLKSGAVIVGIIKDSTPKKCRVEIPGGAFTVSWNTVAKKVKKPCVYGMYLENVKEVEEDPTATLDDWKILANWAFKSDFKWGHRKVYLRLAKKYPYDVDVVENMEKLGYLWDKEGKEWVTQTEYNRRQGLVQYKGDWVTPEDRKKYIALEAEKKEEKRKKREEAKKKKQGKTKRVVAKRRKTRRRSVRFGFSGRKAGVRFVQMSN